MAKLTTLTGPKLVSKIRRANLWKLFVFGLLLLLGILIVAAAVAFVRNEHEYLKAILMLAVGVLLCWWSGTEFGKRLKVLVNVRNSRMFRKYGSPEEIASIISNSAESSLIVNKKVLLTESFIFTPSNPESYVPFESVRLFYRKEHRTNGVQDGLYITVWDEFGDTYDYPFKMGTRHAVDFEDAMKELSVRCKNTMIGYSAANISTVKANKRDI